MVKNGVAYKNGKLIRSDKSDGDTSFRVEASIGDWDSKGVAEKFYNFLGIEGLKMLGINEELDKKVCTGKISENVKVIGIGKAVYTYSVRRVFTAITDEDVASNLHEWLQHGALDQYKGIKQAKIA